MTYGIYISINLTSESYGGSLVGKTNYKLFKNVIGSDVCAISVNKKPIDSVFIVKTTKSRFGTAVANILGLCATLTRQGELEIYEKVRKEQPAIIWLDSSLLGRLIPRLRIESPGVRIVCFFHNLEEDIVLEKIRKGQWAYYIALLATRANERMSAKLADIVVAIQMADAKKILERHGRSPEFILPVCIQDTYSAVEPPNPYPGVRYVLFVGSDFPPNVEALQYLSQEVAPKLENTIVIAVGNGLEKYALSLSHNKMIIKGYVQDLAAIYFHAIAVVAPIFSGGGMKVKIAEALLNGKYVIGSEFSFLGYENALDAGAGIVARFADEYASLIDELSISEYFNSISYKIYKHNYSYESGLSAMNRILANPNKFIYD